jgi:hypothetical protein
MLESHANFQAEVSINIDIVYVAPYSSPNALRNETESVVLSRIN